jgi:alpha-beta hydrolase superfamily lysophospholipase/phosphatidylglycerophosphate synthase/SAM-dependent methyltransferase
MDGAMLDTESAAYHPSARRPIAQAFRKTARGAVNFCVRHRIHPDTVSYSSIVAAGFAAACFVGARWHPWLLLLAPAGIYIRLWLNMLDGMVALASRTASRRGEILNELPDRLSDVLIFAGVAHSGLAHQALGYWAAIFALFTAYVGIFGQAVGARREFAGVMSKPWRMVTLHIGAWIALLFIWAGHGQARFLHLTILDWACVVVIAGCIQTIAVRLASTLRLIDEPADAVRSAKPPFGSEPQGRRQAAARAAVDFDVAHEVAPPHRIVPAEHTFKSFDGVELFYRAWIPSRPTSKALIILHRGHEHSGRMSETVDRLALGDVAVFAWDQRGHGRSPGERGGAESLSAVVKDLDSFAKHLVTAHGVKLTDTILLAHSVGGVIGAAWVHDYAPPLCGMILATPALRVKLYVPFAIPALRLKQRFLGAGHPNNVVKSYVKSRVLTHDPAEQKAYDADPLIFRQIAINILLDLFDMSTRLLDDAGAITTPTLILAAGNDWVVKESAQRKFFERLSSHVKEFDIFPGSYHALFHENIRSQVVARVKTFIVECLERPPASDDARLVAELLNADRGGHTRAEFDRLRAPSLNPIWPIVRCAMKIAGRLSDGIRLGWNSGFDSGITLDYVYANRPAGVTPIGKLIDHNYLNSPGWRGIRQRRVNLEQFLRRAIDETRGAGRLVRIVDIASGPGRYVLETMKSASAGATHDTPHDTTPDVTANITAVLRDYKLANLGVARALADELGLAGQVEIAQADAFDRDSIASIAPRPTIGIASGIYELFPDNDPLRRSLAGLADAIEPGGFLIYTCQPWHPQIEFIARALTNREGRPWVMRRRTQAEMDALVRAAGFEKIDQAIDRWGIFTVGLARRI